MRELKEVGTYLGRSVQVVQLEDLTEFVLRKSTILISTSEFADVHSVRSAIERVFEGEPLAVLVCGDGAEEAFSFMLDLQSHLVGKRHTMTYFSSEQLTESLENFLVSIWPSEDRFEEWGSYLLLISEEGDVVESLLATPIPGFFRSAEEADT